MKTYSLELKSDSSKTFMAQKAANSFDINLSEKLTHSFSIKADVETEYNVGLIVGASGSGKTVLAKKIWGENCFYEINNLNKAVIDLFPENTSYNERASILTGVGLSSVPCWLKPLKVLSNGQRARAQAGLALFYKDNPVIDEWTSVVDRTTAKIMSHCVQKMARRNNKKIVLISCHYDITEWLKPDWVIDCNDINYYDYRGLLWQRKEKLTFNIRKTTREPWKYFSKYHYLTSKLPNGTPFIFGLFYKDKQIGFQSFSTYVPTAKEKIPIVHSSRVAIHPDYIGLGLGAKLTTECARIIKNKHKYRVFHKASSISMKISLEKLPHIWKKKHTKILFSRYSKNKKFTKKVGIQDHARIKVKMFVFEFIE